MNNVRTFFDDPYVYGPLTQEQAKSVTVNHRSIQLGKHFYIGVSQEQPQWQECHVARPEPEPKEE
jgi:hypothetical protein